MSFSSSVKLELTSIGLDKSCCLLAELAGLTRMCGRLSIKSNEKIFLKYTTESAPVIRNIFKIIKEMYGFKGVISIAKNEQLKKNNVYSLDVDDTYVTKELLFDIGFITDNNIFNLNYLLGNRYREVPCCRRTYLRGSFLGGGTILNPDRYYHVEMITYRQDHAEDLVSLLALDHIHANIATRRDQKVVYLRDGNDIALFLNVIGAHKTLLSFEDVRALKHMKNSINRLVNCETANLSKTITASVEQIQAIELLIKKDMFKKLPKDIQVLCKLRLEHKDASLKELGLMMSPIMSKSGVNHRLKKVLNIARDINE